MKNIFKTCLKRHICDLIKSESEPHSLNQRYVIKYHVALYSHIPGLNTHIFPLDVNFIYQFPVAINGA